MNVAVTRFGPVTNKELGDMRMKRKKNFGAPRRVRLASMDMGAIAGEKIVELARDLGAEVEYKFGWMAYAARRMGIGQGIVQSLVRGDYGETNAVGLKIVQRVARKIGLSASELLGEDE